MKKELILWIAHFARAYARSDWKKLKSLAGRVKTVGITSKQLYELVLQGYLFLGFPAAIEAFTALDGTFKNPKETAERSPVWRVKKGEAFCRRIYREKYPILMQSLQEKSPQLAGWIIEEGYGKVLSRRGASLGLRELFSAALLAASGFPKQLFAHLRALVEMGEKTEDLALLVGEASVGLPKKTRSAVWKMVSLLLANRNSVWKVPVSSL